VRSTTAALAAFVFTDSMPYSGERRNKTSSGLLASVALLRGTIERSSACRRHGPPQGEGVAGCAADYIAAADQLDEMEAQR
jgi:hypothetical protein